MPQSHDYRSGPTAFIVSLLKLSVVILTTVIWIPLGFFFWIPLLGRSVAIFSVMVLFSALTRTDPRLIQRQLEQSIEFYPRGFRIIFDVLASPLDHSAGIEAVPIGKFAGRIIVELVWAGLFWATILYGLESYHAFPPVLHDLLKTISASPLLRR